VSALNSFYFLNLKSRFAQIIHQETIQTKRMRYSIIFSVLSTLAVVNATDGPAEAPVAKDNPKATYVATLTESPSKIVGSVKVEGAPGHSGVKYTVQLSGLKKEEALPYLFHVHAKAIPAGGKCADAAAHLTQGPTALNWNCNLKYASNDYTNKLELCEVGQLSGKYGNITADKIGHDGTYAIEFLDLYSSLKPEEKFFIGDKSVVVHNGKNDRLACANFQKASPSY